MHRFNLHAPQMSESFRSRIAHCLHREQRLHIPTIIRLFHKSVLDAKCMRANVNMREYIGHCRDLQGHWLKNYFYCCISGLMVGQGEKLNNGDYSEQDTIRRAITVINKIRPRFLIVSGNFTGKEITTTEVDDEERLNQVEVARKLICRVSETIPIVFVPGINEVGVQPTATTLKAYRSKFGADYYGFWYRDIIIHILIRIRRYT